MSSKTSVLIFEQGARFPQDFLQLWATVALESESNGTNKRRAEARRYIASVNGSGRGNGCWLAFTAQQVDSRTGANEKRWKGVGP